MESIGTDRAGRTLWARTAHELLEAIRGGIFPAGSRLPNERDLMAMYRVSRNTLRRAVAELEQRGLLRTEQGRGSFVQDRIDYALGPRTRLTDNLAGTGLTAERHLLDLREIAAPPDVAEALGLPAGEPAWCLLSQQSAGGLPLNRATTWFPARRFPDFAARRRTTERVTDILRSYGIADYLRAWTRIVARRATEAEARVLGQPTSSPVFEIQKLDATAAGEPISYGSAVWAADRVQFHIPGPIGPGQGVSP